MKPCMTTWPASVPTDERAKPEASSASAKARAAPGPTSASKPGVRVLDRVELGQAELVEQRRGDDQHRHVDQAGEAHRDRHVHPLEAQQLTTLACRGGRIRSWVSAECR